MNKHDSAHEFDAALAAQRTGGLGRNNTLWKPKKQNDAALKSVTLAWAQQLAQAWNGGRSVKVMGGKVGVGASSTDVEHNIDMIWLDDKVTLPKSANDLAAAVGIIAHELGHLKHTPKTNDLVTQLLVQKGIWPTFNTVEDGKQESKMLAVRPGYKKYLEFAVLQHLLATVKPDTIQNLYPLVAGRSYLPERLIDRAREFCVQVFGDEPVDRFDELLADFLEIDPLAMPNETVEIIEEIHSLFPQPQGCGLTPTAGDTDSNPDLDADEVRGRKEKAKKAKKDKAKKDKKDSKEKGEKSDKEETSDDDSPKPGSDDDAEHDEDKDAGGGEEEGEESEDQREGDGDQESSDGGADAEAGEAGDDSGGEGEGEGEGDDEIEAWDPMDSPDLDSDLEENEDQEGGEKKAGKTAGLGAGKNDPDAERTLDDEDANKVLDVLRNLHEVIREDLVADLEEEFELLRSEAFGDGNIRRPLPHEENSQRQMVAALKRMSEQAKGGLDRRRPKGRLNVRRFIQNKERMDVERIAFDKFRPNVQDALDMEVVLLVDNSGSIQGVTEQLSGAMWALVTALESVGGPSVTVVLWNSSFEVKKVPSDKWRAKYVPNIHATGGTSPHEAIKYANQLFKFSRKKQNLCFILTDGAWGGMDLARQLVVEMKTQNDVDTYILGFAGFNPANVDLYGAVDGCSGGLDEVTDFIFKIAEDRMASQLAARGR
jgi:hypothetical protein